MRALRCLVCDLIGCRGHRSLASLLAWVVGERTAAVRSVPYQLHDEDRILAAGERPVHTKGAITGWPYSFSFERYLESTIHQTPAIKALKRMKTRGRQQSLEYRICAALLCGAPANVLALSADFQLPSAVIERSAIRGVELWRELSLAA